MALHIQVLGEKRDSGPLHERQPLKRKNTCCLTEVARCNEAKTSMWYVGDLGSWG